MVKRGELCGECGDLMALILRLKNAPTFSGLFLGSCWILERGLSLSA
jgi:hypothetical protein